MVDLGIWMSPVADRTLGWFVETTLVALILTVVAAIGGRLRWLAPSPAARHALWLMVLLKLVAPPLVEWPWSIPSIFPGSRIETASGWPKWETMNVPVELDLTSEADSESAPIARSVDALKPVWRPIPLSVWIFSAWLIGSIVVSSGQVGRILRFRRLLRQASSPPEWLVEEIEWVAERLRVRLPSIRVVPGLATPLVWCLGRPVLLIPSSLLKSMDADRWRAILTHELAHLRRGDHWVRRLDLVAGLVWWWNPLYWLAHRKIDLESEMASDAWVLWAAPEDRITYAESLLRICVNLPPAGLPSPSMGVAGSGLSFERRLTMILRNPADRRVSVQGIALAVLLAGLSMPSWSLAKPVQPVDELIGPLELKIQPHPVVAPVVMEIQVDVISDDDDEDDDKAETSKSKEKLAKDKAKQDAMQKKMEEVGKQMEAKFGPGSEFAKQMEAMGKDMEAKFGPGSEFAKQMEDLGSSDDEDEAKKAKDKARSVRDEARKTKLKAEGEVRKAKLKGDADARKLRAEARKTKEKAEGDTVQVRVKTDKPADPRTQRIEALESRINDLMKEMKQLKAEAASSDKKDEEG